MKQSPQHISQVELDFLECWVLFNNSMHQRQKQTLKPGTRLRGCIGQAQTLCAAPGMLCLSRCITLQLHCIRKGAIHKQCRHMLPFCRRLLYQLFYSQLHCLLFCQEQLNVKCLVTTTIFMSCLGLRRSSCSLLDLLF